MFMTRFCWFVSLVIFSLVRCQPSVNEKVQQAGEGIHSTIPNSDSHPPNLPHENLDVRFPGDGNTNQINSQHSDGIPSRSTDPLSQQYLSADGGTKQYVNGVPNQMNTGPTLQKNNQPAHGVPNPSNQKIPQDTERMKTDSAQSGSFTHEIPSGGNIPGRQVPQHFPNGGGQQPPPNAQFTPPRPNVYPDMVPNQRPDPRVHNTQPPPNYYEQSNFKGFERNHEQFDSRNYHDGRDGMLRNPNDNMASRSAWQHADHQQNYHDNFRKPQANIPHEYQLDDIFTLPSREDPLNNRADFVSLVVIVPPGVKHCYFYNPISNFDIDYQVVKGGHLDVGIFVRDPEGEPIAVRPPLSDSQVSISVPKYFRLMPYAVCLDNRKASYAYKYVYFSIDVNINWDNPSELERQAIEALRSNALANSQAQAASAEHAESIEKLMAQLDIIFGRLRRIEHMQQRSINFDSTDSTLMEDNLERITTGSVFQVILMIAVATLQVGLIRALFDQQSYFYKLWFGIRSQSINARC
ncbi:unnamed protein product [Trichobilharzia szidati]|nr:unnamed protein product [Trichobilharzia szidati]